MPKIQFRRGNKNGLPALSPGEPALTLDTSELFVGGQSGNLQVPVLGSDGKVPSAQLPAMNYIPTSQKGVAGGVATLDGTGKIPVGQIPAGDYFTKAQSLQAATAAAFDLPASAVPDDVLAKIAILIDALETNSVKIATGSYVGTGTYGSSNPNSLTFDFEPKAIFITVDRTGGLNAGIYFISPQTKSSGIGTFSSSSSSSEITVSWGKTVFWYDEDSDRYQFNSSGYKYIYLAIG